MPADPAIPVGIPYWSLSPSDLFSALGSSAQGLSAEDAARRLASRGDHRRRDSGSLLASLRLLAAQFNSPIDWMLAGAALLSFLLDSPTDGAILMVILLLSGLLGFWQERGAADAVRQLLLEVCTISRVLRDGVDCEVPREEVVPGDVLLLAAGSALPADCRLLEERDLSAEEASLTGESFAVSKHPPVLPADTPLARRRNVLHMGTHVVSGMGRALVIHTGRDTVFGSIADHLGRQPAETEFEQGVRRFGALLLEVTLLLVLAIFAVNVFLQRPAIDSFLFALALGVGLTPQLLPAILSVNLASGARRMARQRVIVRRLASIENFGSMGVLCSDKTGTLTEGTASLRHWFGLDGQPCERVRLLAVVNASFESGFPNAIDVGIRAAARADDLRGWTKIDELPFDFSRKRQSVLARQDGEPLLITKGAVAQVLAVCGRAQLPDGSLVPLEAVRDSVNQLVERWSAEGDRLLALAVRRWPAAGSAVPRAVEREAEADMVLLGLIGLSDPIKPGVPATVAELERLGVRLKILSGDNPLAAARVAREAGLRQAEVISGAALDRLSDQALTAVVNRVDVFAEIEPRQKERLVRALRQAGHVVGFLGDGINDAPALQAADVGLSVQGAVDVAKEAADIVLLEPDLGVLVGGIREGRRTFANTLKYVFMATSANFGNMVSMAGASVLLPFLPLLPKQILLTNLLTDLPEMTIAGDRVDADWIERPHRWSIPFIQRFMLCFGLVSSLFDFLTFAVLLWLLHADASQFRTGWFVESVLSAAMIVLVIRTRGPLLRSRPPRALVLATGLIVVISLSLPWTPLGHLFGFVPLPGAFLGVLAVILLAYGAAAEWVKGWFYRGASPTVRLG
jgi:P-type Mg2+ transporter